jgi:RHS repeat-associated protein
MDRHTAKATPEGTLNYTYDAAGHVASISPSNSSSASISYSFDGIYRLTNETIAESGSHSGSVSYGLDPVGNRLNDTSSLTGVPSGSWSFNADDQVSGENYDQNGNVTAADGKTFTYDSENHLVTMAGSGTSAIILYDGDGNRVAKTVGNTTTFYLVDDLNPTGYPQVVEELTGSAVTRQYTYGLQRIDENQQISGTWTPSFYGYDGGGNVRQLTNTAGTVTDSYEYDAYGNSFTVSGTTPNNYLYRGEQYDADLGLYYLRARYYNPLTGRFMSRDPNSPGPFDSNGNPTDPKALHKYLYAGGDPINGIDPSGRDFVELKVIAKELLAATAEAVFWGGNVICGEYAALAWTLKYQFNKPTPFPADLACETFALAEGTTEAIFYIVEALP